MGSPHNITAEELPIVCREYEQGSAMGVIARKLGCSRTQVKQVLVSQGIEIRESAVKVRAVDPTPDEIIAMTAEFRKRRGIFVDTD